MKLVSVETPEKSVCKMTFSASPEELEAASNAVYERTRASYTIRGFKKGEADRAQIEADRGEHTFWYDAINDLMDKDVPALYDAAMAEHSFVAVDNPVYDLVSVKKDEGFVATATVALQPELNLTKTTGFTAECVTPEVTDKEIDNVLERRRAAAAELVPHKGPAVKGNIVHIDYEGLLEGKPFQGGTAKNQAVQLGSGRMIPGFEEGILGHKAGEEFEIFCHGVEKRSKVRSRIVADQLVKLIKEADHVVIMGHRMSDLDAIGSAEGVLRICKICDVPAVIAVRRDATLAGSLINALIAAGQEDDFIDPKGALPIISQRTLCIVVDTYQLGLVESREILEKCGKVAVIDHHRKGVGFIEKADLVCHEPYASSASELVTEFLQYVGDRDDKPNRIEAEGLLSGIMLDTRDFTLHTGVRTFEAAAALRRYGAETEHVRQLFDVSMVEYTTKAMLVSEAQMYRGCAITVSGEVAPEARVAIAQAANDLLTIQNVEASFVAVQVGGGVNISARSLGAVNVQVIMEALGGGGHQTMAAAQLKHITPEAARSRIQTAIDQYREAQKKSGLESGSEQKKKDKQ